MQTVEELEQELKALEAQETAKLKARADAAKMPAMLREVAFRKAKIAALDKYQSEQLFDADVAGVGPVLLHWPDEITYDHYMKGTGAIKGDLSQMSADKIENLIARCAVFPEGPVMLKELREKNPHARTVLANKLFEKMRKGLEDEGK